MTTLQMGVVATWSFEPFLAGRHAINGLYLPRAASASRAGWRGQATAHGFPHALQMEGPWFHSCHFHLRNV